MFNWNILVTENNLFYFEIIGFKKGRLIERCNKIKNFRSKKISWDNLEKKNYENCPPPLPMARGTIDKFSDTKINRWVVVLIKCWGEGLLSAYRGGGANLPPIPAKKKKKFMLEQSGQFYLVLWKLDMTSW